MVRKNTVCTTAVVLLMNVGEPENPSTLSEAYMANERAKEAAANGEGTAEGLSLIHI